MTTTSHGHHEAIVVGGGQAGLATAYYLLARGVDTLVLDNNMGPGGAWSMYWDTMTLLSEPAQSSLPGMAMPDVPGGLTPAHMVEYLTNYEGVFDIPVRRPVRVLHVRPAGAHFTVETDQGTWTASQVIMATGTYARPLVPHVEGTIMGQFWHVANYPGRDTFRGKKVAVVGAGNAAAQIGAELSEVAEVIWLTDTEPRLVDASLTGADYHRLIAERRDAILAGATDVPSDPAELGNIIQTPPVKAAIESGALTPTPLPETLDGLEVNHLIWATGFEPGLYPVRGLVEDGRPSVEGLHLVGYGGASGYGSDTIAGIGPWAQHTARTVAEGLGKR
ncbi:FAD-dependent oxidoreductase [Corynebacterium guangdongense]|uniref:Flavoprotein involved in K+ transport n=1 Tax=Corynebacterium guangdongense TaxID=1783348 RepID=A0ABU2A032_9CORY|nr:FAD-dependent oxidoreductase [Corynebacterium guangdongense]MDR7330542.1 putative flavoprotein involved in K+ transport [Corynebacterium guangdongense]WJZ19096.1 putative oxidoreductase CzcO [Corynebacterium guangdongense]